MGVSVFSSQIRQPAVRKNARNKVLLKMQIHNFPDLTGNAKSAEKAEAEKAVKDTIKSKLQLRDSDIAWDLDIANNYNNKIWEVKASIAVPGTTAESQKSSLQSALQSGADLAASLEEKLEALKDVDDIEVYRSNLKVAKDNTHAEFVVDLLVTGIDFGKLDALPAMQHNIRTALQTAIASEAKDNPDAAFTESIKLIRPCEMNSASVLFHAKIPAPENAQEASDMETKLNTGVDSSVSQVAKNVQDALCLKVKNALSTTNIRVYTAAEVPDKPSSYECQQ